ncbi:MAG: hypothetical protein HC904_09715 [Blastochloris sp.]|nr:hypothetical protein [Blastochloris sp.]
MAFHRWHASSGSYAPLGYVRGVAVDLTRLILAFHILSTVICAFAFDQRPFWELELLFTTSSFWEGRIWTVLTDPFYHNIAEEHVWLALNLFLFYQFGTEIERLIGRVSYGFLYVALMLVPALVCLMLAPLVGELGVRVPYVFTLAHFAIFVGFAYVYPDVPFFFGLSARWLAWILIGVFTLAIVASGAWQALIPYAAGLGTVYLYLRFVGAGRDLGMWEVWKSWRAQRHESEVLKRQATHRKQKEEVQASVDSILEKIHQHGLHSLTPKERAYLEQQGTKLRDREAKERR